MNELKPCPFCGSLKVDLCWQEEKFSYQSSTFWYFVFCKDCYCEGKHVSDESGAINFWNTRPIEAALRLKLDKAREALRYIGYSKGVSAVDFSWKNEWQYLREYAKKAMAELDVP